MSDIAALVADNLDIWTGAIERKSGAGRGGGGKRINLYGIDRLRALVLDLAVRGKLVPQDPADEPASELLRRVKAERAKLIKNKEIGKGKSLPTVSNAPPFEIPESWEWTQLSEVGHDWGQREPDSDFTYIDVSAIDQSVGVIRSPNIVAAKDAPSRARKIVRSGTIIYSTVRPYLLNIAIIDRDFAPEPIASTAFAIIHPFTGIEAGFVYRFLRSPAFVNYVESCQTGIAYPAINDRQFFSAWCPLPPSSEQRRIVAKVDELMALCDALERVSTDALAAHQVLVETLLATLVNSDDAAALASSWARLESHFDTLFTTEATIDALKQTILDLAVRGKLVEQDERDEAADELVRRIERTRLEMVHARLAKRLKTEKAIRHSELDYSLPKNWTWSRVEHIALVGTGSTPSRDRKDYYFPQEFSWVTSGETSNEFIAETSEMVSALAIAETNVSICPPGTLVMALYGQGKTRGQISELLIEAGTNQACATIQLIETAEFHRKFVKLFFKMAYDAIRRKSAGGAQPNLNVGKVAELPIPIPPLAEQRRIVAKVDELMALCDALKARLADAVETRRHLADAIVERAAA